MTIESVEELLLTTLDERQWYGGDVEVPPYVPSSIGRVVFDHLYRWDDVPEEIEEY
jgi:hypothetical protein